MPNQELLLLVLPFLGQGRKHRRMHLLQHEPPFVRCWYRVLVRQQQQAPPMAIQQHWKPLPGEEGLVNRFLSQLEALEEEVLLPQV